MLKGLDKAIAIASVLFCSTASAQTVSEAINDYCKCAAPVLQQASGLMDAMNSGDMAKMTQIVTFMEQNGGEMVKCMENLEEKYMPLEDDKEFEEQVKAGIEQECPNPLRKMGQAMGAMMKQ